ncbi:MAG: exodeoxyribonuclease V subunit gamma [Proteobacteria bacterium]|nr:exodeoxyribonuclease V subunit gamma [Pseudomonadota bacterium]
MSRPGNIKSHDTPHTGGLYVHCATDLACHADTLIASLLAASHDPVTSLFAPPTIVVPHSLAGDYIRSQIACSELGCAFGIKTLTLHTFFSENHLDSGAFSAEMIKAALLTLLVDPSLRSKIPDDVQRYVYDAPPGVKHPELRIYQFAGQVSSIFASYAREQPKILSDWTSDRPYSVATSKTSIEAAFPRQIY